MNEKEAKKFLEKIDNGEKLSESELRELCENAFQDDLGEQHRWTQTITSYVDLNHRIFAVEWERGLTEMQENGYYKQPYEVEEVEEVVTIHKWIKKEEMYNILLKGDDKMIERDNIGTCKHKGKTGFSRYMSSCSCNKEKKARNNRFLMQTRE